MAKFKVGDKVRYVSGGWYEIGEELYVLKNDGSKHMPILLGPSLNTPHESDEARWVDLEDVGMVDQPDEILTRISAIESELSALKALVQADSKPVEPTLTGNAARKAVIEKARAFASGHTRFALDNVEFYVNTEKGVVTALKKSRYGTVLCKAFARCAPDDVFNADIGKAIAVGRLYGVDIPQEFFDAPKPDEVVVGMRARMNAPDGYISTIVPEGQFAGSDTNAAGWVRDNPDFLHAIIDDTEAQY